MVFAHALYSSGVYTNTVSHDQTHMELYMYVYCSCQLWTCSVVLVPHSAAIVVCDATCDVVQHASLNVQYS